MLKVVKNYLKEHPSIGNRMVREITGIGYDQAIFFFRVMMKEHQLEKSGKGSATSYALVKSPAKDT